MLLKPILPLGFLLCILLCSPATAQLEFPDTPAPGELIQDYADIISAEDQEAIRDIQFESYETHDTPICVVTIASKQTFGGQNASIEKVAHDLFDQWQIGKRNADDKLINQGILLLVSVGDRKARIELGADWGHKWNGHCDQIMDRAIVPKFKKGDYSAGILAGVKRLAQMGKSGPAGSAPISLVDEFNEPMLEGFNPLPRWAGIGLLVLGVVLIVLGILYPDYQRPLILTGLALMLFALIFHLVLFLLGLLPNGRNSYDSSGWSGGGGYSSGGYSGGGGSTGSW